jgi:hypothetical protein
MVSDLAARIRVERISQSSRGMQPGDPVARLSADGCEKAAR